MNLLIKLDLAILDGFFQPIADWWMNLTGKTNFWISRLLWWIVIVAGTWETLFRMHREDGLSKAPSYIVMCVIMGLVSLYFIHLDTNEEALFRNTENARFLNFRRGPEWGLLRVMTIVLSSYLASDNIIYFGWISDLWGTIVGAVTYPIALYFGACTPKPRLPDAALVPAKS